jgi:hypothetical protein
MKPITNPNAGEITMNIAVLRTLSVLSTCQPAFAMPAPPKPPMSACDDEVGSPSRHVIRFQVTAPTKPAKITASETIPDSGRTVFPTVSATCVPKIRNAAKLKKAAQMTAARGVSTRVDTTVAIEFAASWKPFV